MRCKMRSTVRCWSITWATSCGRGWRPSMANGFIDKTWQNHFWNLRGLIQFQCQTRCPPECRASENLQVDNLQMSFLPSHRRNCKLKYLSDKPTALVRRRPRNFAYNASNAHRHTYRSALIGRYRTKRLRFCSLFACLEELALLQKDAESLGNSSLLAPLERQNWHQSY